MVDMKVFFVSVSRWEIVEGELVEGIEETRPLKKIITPDGDRFVPPTTKLWTNKVEMMADEFAKHFKRLGSDEFISRYKLTKDEARAYLEIAKDKYPEKFI
jgi:hypothetical protein